MNKDCKCNDCTCKEYANFVSKNPGRDVQRIATARLLKQDPSKIHNPVWGITGSLGDSQCYVGVMEKVNAIHKALSDRIKKDDLQIRLIPPAFTLGVSDGQLNGTPEMRFSLIGREIVHDAMTLHLSGSKVQGHIAVVACDKPPVGTLVAIVEHNEPAIIMSDGSIKPGTDPQTHERIDIVTGFQVAGDLDQEKKNRIALNACCGQGSCGGMFTYNTMQTFIAVSGLEPLHMVTPASEDTRRIHEFPNQLIDYLLIMTKKGIKPQDIVTPASLKNALTVVIAMGGSTNVVLHSVEIARAAGIHLWKDVLSQEEFNELSQKIPVIINARPFGKYSMVDIEEKGGLPVIVKELLEAGFLDGDCITCTGETLSQQISRLNPSKPDEEVIYPIAKPFKKTGGLRLLKGNLASEGGAVIKVAGIEAGRVPYGNPAGIVDGKFTGKARTFNNEKELLEALEKTPDIFQDQDMVVVRYEGPRGAPGMPEMLDPTSRITTLCRQKHITIALMTDGRFSGGSIGVVIGHIGPEAFLGGPIALIEDGDTIIVDLNSCIIDCGELSNSSILQKRKRAWEKEANKNGGVHPAVKKVTNRLLKRMRATALSAIEGAGMN